MQREAVSIKKVLPNTLLEKTPEDRIGGVGCRCNPTAAFATALRRVTAGRIGTPLTVYGPRLFSLC